MHFCKASTSSVPEEEGVSSEPEQTEQRRSAGSAPGAEQLAENLRAHLERGQFVTETSRPLARASLSARATLGLWALRILVVVVSAMVVYAFVTQLN
jgi:hypothetical protein